MLTMLTVTASAFSALCGFGPKTTGTSIISHILCSPDAFCSHQHIIRTTRSSQLINQRVTSRDSKTKGFNQRCKHPIDILLNAYPPSISIACSIVIKKGYILPDNWIDTTISLQEIINRSVLCLMQYRILIIQRPLCQVFCIDTYRPTPTTLLLGLFEQLIGSPWACSQQLESLRGMLGGCRNKGD